MYSEVFAVTCQSISSISCPRKARTFANLFMIGFFQIGKFSEFRINSKRFYVIQYVNYLFHGCYTAFPIIFFVVKLILSKYTIFCGMAYSIFTSFFKKNCNILYIKHSQRQKKRRFGNSLIRTSTMTSLKLYY